MQLLTIAIPKLEEMQRDGEDGRKKIASITRYVTVGLSLIESSAMAIGFGRQGLLETYNVFSIIILSTPGTGSCDPKRITTNIANVKKIFFLNSLILKA